MKRLITQGSSKTVCKNIQYLPVIIVNYPFVLSLLGYSECSTVKLFILYEGNTGASA